MTEQTDVLAGLDEAIEKARGLGMIPHGSRHQSERGAFFAARAKRRGETQSPRVKPARAYLATRMRGGKGPGGKARTGIYKSEALDALDDVIEKAGLRINGGVKVSPAQRRNLAIKRGEDANERAGYSRTRGPHLGSGRRDTVKRVVGATQADFARHSFVSAKAGKWSDKKLERYVVQRERKKIDANRAKHGKPSLYRQKKHLLGGTTLELKKAKPKTLYVYRPVENAEDILSWARGQGFKSLLPADKLHVTIIASATEINWATLFDDYHMEPSDRPSYCDCGPVYNPVEQNKSKTIEGGVREVKKLGDKGAVVLGFESLSLMQRFVDLRRAGAVSKFSAFQPHITLTLSGDVPKDVTPYEGKIVLGEECWEEFKDGAYENVEETVTKAALDDLTARLSAAEAALAKTKEAA